MPSYKNFTATILDTSTARPLQEYMTSHNPLTNTCQTYIESHANQPFTIVLRDDSLLAQSTSGPWYAQMSSPAAPGTNPMISHPQSALHGRGVDFSAGRDEFSHSTGGDGLFYPAQEGLFERAEGGVAQGTAVHVDGVYVDNGLTGPGIAVERRWYGKRVDHMFVKPFVFRENTSGTSRFPEIPFPLSPFFPHLTCS
jgi:hypothetical protein